MSGATWRTRGRLTDYASGGLLVAALVLVHAFDRARVRPGPDKVPGRANLLDTSPLLDLTEAASLEPRTEKVAIQGPPPPAVPERPERTSVAINVRPGTAAVKSLEAVVVGLMARQDLNKFGNPEGKELGLAAQGEFRGARLLVWSAEPEASGNIFTADNPLWASLRDKGFEVRMERDGFRSDWLGDADQLWVFTGLMNALTDSDIARIIDFVDAGKGLYLLADNEPYLADARRIVRRMYGSDVTGDFVGRNLIAVRGHGVTRDDFRLSGIPATFNPDASDNRSRLAVIQKATHYAEEHPLLTDVNFIFEGSTISHLSPTPHLQTVLKAFDGQVLAAVSVNPRQRVVVDCGYTRYFYSPAARLVTETAGTLRYAENIAAYLMGKDEKGGAGSNWRERRALLAKYQEADETVVATGLRDANPDERWAALTAAFRRRLNIPAPLIGMLVDTRPDVSGQARRALVQLAGGRDYGPPPSASAGEKETARRAWAAWLNREKLTERAVSVPLPEILAMLGRPDADERGAALRAALRRRLDLPDAYIRLLSDPESEIREDAHEALVQLAGREDYGPAAGTGDPERAAAVDDWRRWHAVRKHPALVTQARPQEVSAALHSKDADQRRAAVLAIRRRRLPLVIDLIHALSDPEVGVQQDARQTLILLANHEDHGPAPGSPPDEIRRSASEWKVWWDRKEARITDQMLRLAKSLLDRNPAAARERLRQIVDEHPGTDEVREARRLLDQPR